MESIFNKVAGKRVCNFIKNRIQHSFPINIMKFLRKTFSIEHPRWLLLVTAWIIWRYFEKWLLQNSKDNNSISVDMKFYSLQLKQKPKASVSNGILRSFKTATLENKFLGEEGCFWKENRGGEGRTMTLVVSCFLFLRGSYFLSNETMFFLHKFLQSGAFGLCLDYVIHFYILTKVLVVQFLPSRF